MIYIFIYGIFLLIGIYDIKKKGLLKEKSRNALLNLMILVLTLFRGLRWNTGTDWEQFLEVFQYVDEDSALVFIRNTGEILEPGYTFLNYLVKCIFDHYTAFLLISNFIVLICYKFFAVNIITRYQCLAFVMIIITYQFFPVRQNIAGAILMVSLVYFIKKKYCGFILLAIVASLFHKSSLIVLPLIFLSRKNFNNQFYIIAYLIIPFLNISFLNNGIVALSPYICLISEDFDTAVKNYMNYGIGVIPFSLGSYLYYFLLLLLFCYVRKVALTTELSGKFNIIFNLFFINIWGMKMAQITGIFGLIRLFSYFDFCINILFCFYVLLQIDGKLKVVKNSFFISCFSFLFFFGFYFNKSIRSYSNLIFPYYSVFNSSYHRYGNPELKNTEDSFFEIILK